MSRERNQMHTILNEIKKAVREELYYLAIMLCLTLPDICAAMEHPKAKASEPQYIAWFEQWLGKKYGRHLTARDMYRLRCGVLHQGRMGQPGMPYDRIIFSLPAQILTRLNTLVEGQRNLLNLNAKLFCRDIVMAVEAWSAAHENDPIVQRNLSRSIQYRPDGLPLIAKGLPCVSWQVLSAPELPG
jgi:hypothetical protein